MITINASTLYKTTQGKLIYKSLVNLYVDKLVGLCAANDLGIQIAFKLVGVLDVGGVNIPFSNAIYRNVSVVEDVTDQRLVNARSSNTQENTLLFAGVEESFVSDDFVVVEFNSVLFDSHDSEYENEDRNDQNAG